MHGVTANPSLHGCVPLHEGSLSLPGVSRLSPAPGWAGPTVAGLLEMSSHHFSFFLEAKESFHPPKAGARVGIC